MPEVFPEPIRSLPQANVPLRGTKAYLSQSENHQIVFWRFDENVEVPEHSHEDQWGVVLEGKIDLVIEGVKRTYKTPAKWMKLAESSRVENRFHQSNRDFVGRKLILT